MKKNVLLLESVTDEAYRILAGGARVLEAVSPFAGLPIAKNHRVHAIVTRGKGDVNKELISGCPHLEVIARCGVGLDNIDVPFATSRGIKVVNAPGSNADTVAEHALSLMLALQRDLYSSIAAVKNDHWAFRNNYAGDEIRGKTLGILGLGNIGEKVARLAVAFGMEVIYWDLAPKPEVDYSFCTFDELLDRSDIISLHLPLVEATRGLIDRSALSKMHPHALIINTSRGAVIDQPALAEVLMEKTIGGFAADVLAVEPPDANDPFLNLDNVLITPHSASLTARTYNEMCVLTVQNTIALLQKKSIEPIYIFNRKDL